jgi:hypothetical protein
MKAKIIKMVPRPKIAAQIENSCGGQGCSVTYVMPFGGGKVIPFTKFPSKKAA